MTTLGLLVMVGCLFWIIRGMSQGLNQGLRAAVTVFVIMPHQLKIVIPGLPDLSIHRLALLLFLPCLPRLLRESSGWRQVPFVFSLLALAGAQLISVILSVDISLSLKNFLSFFCEILLFYIIVSVSIHDWDDVIGLLKAACRGLIIVAILAVIEKYWGFNAFESLTGTPVKSEWGVVATYSHRILLGYAVAMTLPLIFLWTVWETNGPPRLLTWLGLILVVAACYFSTSRGPWMAAAMAGVVSMVLNGREAIRRMAVLLGLAALVCVVRPGVWESLSGLTKQTFESNTLKGQSYDYRWKLWGIALSEIEKSPTRFLFGYGGQSTETMDLSRYFGHEEGGTAVTIGFTSWDNNMACYLIEFGTVGFALELLIYFYVLRRLISSWRLAGGDLRRLLAAVTASCMVYVFALSNVYIFAPQLNYLFWILVAVGTAGVRFWPEFEANADSRYKLQVLENSQAPALGDLAVSHLTTNG